jgi:centromeric protein E
VLLILLGGFGAYMLIGMQMNQRKHGTSSMESLPHLEFWRDFPFLVKDGINYSLLTLFNLIRQVQGKEQR